MSTTTSLPVDELALLADTAIQREAARRAQDVFGEIFRQAFAADAAARTASLQEAETACVGWCREADGEKAQALRVALLVSGLDQWGLAYTQAFELTAIPALSALIGALRGGLDPRSDALFQQYFQQLEEQEAAAIDFKVELRRGIHLALWHAMVACASTAEAQTVLQPLGSMMVALNAAMPNLGWRLLADALAHIQIGLLRDAGAASEVARESTQLLFESLQHALPPERYQTIMRHSGQVLLAWQQASRAKDAGRAGLPE